MSLTHDCYLKLGRARPAVVWDSYNEGCSVRILNPHTYSVSVWKLLSCLQEYFGSLVGANTYLTPPGSQGFAPHYGMFNVIYFTSSNKFSSCSLCR